MAWWSLLRPRCVGVVGSAVNSTPSAISRSISSASSAEELRGRSRGCARPASARAAVRRRGMCAERRRTGLGGHRVDEQRMDHVGERRRGARSCGSASTSTARFIGAAGTPALLQRLARPRPCPAATSTRTSQATRSTRSAGSAALSDRVRQRRTVRVGAQRDHAPLVVARARIGRRAAPRPRRRTGPRPGRRRRRSVAASWLTATSACEMCTCAPVPVRSRPISAASAAIAVMRATTWSGKIVVAS